MNRREVWWRRMQVAWVLYAIGAVLAVVSLTLPLFSGDFPWGSEERMWEVLVEVLGDVFSADIFTGVTGMEFLTGVMPVLGFCGSYLFVLPGFYFLWLAAQQGIALWLARILVTLLLAMGPGAMTVLNVMELNFDELFAGAGSGFWMWYASPFPLAAAFWVVRARGREEAPEGMVPTDPPVEVEGGE